VLLIRLSPDQALKMDQNTVLVWKAQLDQPDLSLREMTSLLDGDELLRANRLIDASGRLRWIASRAFLRRVLAFHTGVAASRIRFTAGAHGKPALDPAVVQFNLSHSHDLAFCAVTGNHAVGVDVEKHRPGFATAQVAARFFSAMEQHAFDTMPGSQRESTFFDIWARKESYIKARGEGISLGLASFAVSADRENPSLVWSSLGPGEIERWEMHHIDAGPGFSACLTVERGAGPVVPRTWPL
jgi:4'-phosphopantetheinyl transferase